MSIKRCLPAVQCLWGMSWQNAGFCRSARLGWAGTPRARPGSSTPVSVYMAPPTVSLDDYRRALIAQPDPCRPAVPQAIIVPRIWSLRDFQVIRTRCCPRLFSLSTSLLRRGIRRYKRERHVSLGGLRGETWTASPSSRLLYGTTVTLSAFHNLGTKFCSRKMSGSVEIDLA